MSCPRWWWWWWWCCPRGEKINPGVHAEPPQAPWSSQQTCTESLQESESVCLYLCWKESTDTSTSYPRYTRTANINKILAMSRESVRLYLCWLNTQTQNILGFCQWLICTVLGKESIRQTVHHFIHFPQFNHPLFQMHQTKKHGIVVADSDYRTIGRWQPSSTHQPYGMGLICNLTFGGKNNAFFWYSG